ncbi:MAG: excinuclease ABC subunit UvrB [Ruminococcaceae bacterium]|nr:excinuclease ABC subunit UvrB [Oscillospiraceae bacterium]
MNSEQKRFVLHSEYKPTGDQPEAIKALTEGVLAGEKMQTLLGVTGSGKTFTMANVIANVQKPTLVLAHNKTLAAQLCSEFREFFPENAVEYFVSYYDYYQPEAYIPGRDMYIEKDAQINDEIDMLRHSATSSLFERRDVIIVASVSCIYSLGDPREYQKLLLAVRPGMAMSRDDFIHHLIAISYDRNDIDFARDRFRVRGDTVDVFPASSSDKAIRVEFFGDEIDRVSEIQVVTGELLRTLSYAAIYPASHYAVSDDKREAALAEIEREMRERVEFFKNEGKLLEAQRIEERVKYDLEMLREVGFCSGVENYSRVLAGRPAGSTPYTLFDYFPRDFLLFVDESHMTLPQVRGMSGGDRARKTNLIEYGFRLPSAFDNRPLFFEEFESKLNQTVFVSATPGDYEAEHSERTVEQIIRPTGLLDPDIEVRPVEGQVDDLLMEIRARTAKNERVLVTTLTRKMAEDLSGYLELNGVKVKYIHYDVQTMERTQIIRDLRLGVFDVLIGINLLREGLDIPEVSLVAILDADKEGFLRAERGLIQTVGRAARNADGHVIMYADRITESMAKTIAETNRRRTIQDAYNKANGIVPKTVVKGVRDVIEIGVQGELSDNPRIKAKAKAGKLTAKEKTTLIEELTKKMHEAAKRLDFEEAVLYRDRIRELENAKKS